MNTNVSDTARLLRRLDAILIQFNIPILKEQEQMQGAKGLHMDSVQRGAIRNPPTDSEKTTNSQIDSVSMRSLG